MNLLTLISLSINYILIIFYRINATIIKESQKISSPQLNLILLIVLISLFFINSIFLINNGLKLLMNSLINLFSTLIWKKWLNKVINKLLKSYEIRLLKGKLIFNDENNKILLYLGIGQAISGFLFIFQLSNYLINNEFDSLSTDVLRLTSFLFIIFSLHKGLTFESDSLNILILSNKVILNSLPDMKTVGSYNSSLEYSISMISSNSQFPPLPGVIPDDSKQSLIFIKYGKLFWSYSIIANR